MRIGLITHHWVPNFGANLQALATVSFLRQQGHEVKVIDYRPLDLVALNKQKVSPEQMAIHESFQHEYFDLTEEFSSAEQLKKNINKYQFDFVLSGSDALFRLDAFKKREDLNFPNPFWLDWVFEGSSAIKSGFVSVSNMGSDFSKLPKNTRDEIGVHLSNFPIISVRDNWTKKSLLKLNESLTIEETIDPVFILNDHFEIPEKYKIKLDDRYVLLSPYKQTVGKKWIVNFVGAANDLGYKVYSLPHPEGHAFNKDVNGVIDLPLSPLEWYTIIQQSAGYLGVRFHPIVTAIANEVPFVSLDTYQTSFFNPSKSKTYDACSRFGLEKYCLGKFRRKFYSPEKVAELIDFQNNQKDFSYKSILEREKEKLRASILRNITTY